MIRNESYSYTKLLYKLCKISWYIQKHAIRDAKRAGHKLSIEMYKEMKVDIDKNIEKLRAAIEGLSREGKY